MIEPAVAQNLVKRLDGSPFWILGAVHNSLEARIDNGARAHHAGFESDVKSAALKPPAAQLSAGLLDRENFGMVGGLFFAFPSVLAAPDDLALKDDHGANWNLADLGGGSGQL